MCPVSITNTFIPNTPLVPAHGTGPSRTTGFLSLVHRSQQQVPLPPQEAGSQLGQPPPPPQSPQSPEPPSRETGDDQLDAQVPTAAAVGGLETGEGRNREQPSSMGDPAGLAALEAKLAGGAFAEAAALLDEAELEGGAAAAGWPAATHLLCLLAAGRLPDARFLLKRLPPGGATEPQVAAAAALLGCLWRQQYPQAWQALGGFAWGPQEAVVVAGLAAKLRADVLSLLGKAYAGLAPGAAAAQLGLPEGEAVAAALAAGWSQDAGSGVLLPPTAATPAEVRTSPANLQALTDYVVHLEQY
eukprot:jgi/Tetstr1/460593/TSEL_000518.t1